MIINSRMACCFFLSSSFVISEIAFFEKWWNEQTLSTQNIVRKLVFKGQLHFVGGGYTQNDEATTHYTAIIDNLALGFYFIKKHFGKCTHWQKSATMSMILFAIAAD